MTNGITPGSASPGAPAVSRSRRTLLQHCASGRNLRRAATTAAIVGPILTLINQPAVLSSLVAIEPPPAATLVRIALTFTVPFVVSLVSSALADRARGSA